MGAVAQFVTLGWMLVLPAIFLHGADSKDRPDMVRVPEELTTTHRGRHVSRNPRGGHHNIGFCCAR